MSRIGKKPITIPKGVTVAIKDRELEVKGTKGVLKTPIPEGVTFKLDGDELVAERASNEQAALHGLARALANNAILGVMQGFRWITEAGTRASGAGLAPGIPTAC